MFDFINQNDPNIIPPSENEYIFIIDEETGKRITSLLVGIPSFGMTIQECLGYAQREYPNNKYVVGNEEMQQQLCAGYLYIDGAVTPPPEPTAEEKQRRQLAIVDSKYSAILKQDDADIIQAVTVLQDEDLAEARRILRQQHVAEYVEERSKL